MDSAAVKVRRDYSSTLRSWLLILALGSFVPLSASAQTASELMERGQSRAVLNDLDGARKDYLAANRMAGGQSIPALLGLGGVEYRSQRYKQARKTAERIIELAETAGERFSGYHLLGISWLEEAGTIEKRLAKAEQALRRALEESVEPAPATLHSLSIVLERSGRTREALAVNADLIRGISQDDPMARRARVKFCELRKEVMEQEGGAATAAALGIEDPTRAVAGFEGSEPARVEGAVQPPEKIWVPQPRYPARARSLRTQGVVIVHTVIDEMGCVASSKVLQGLSKELDAAAVDSVDRWVFEPARLDGKPVSVYYNLTINFRLGR